MTKNIAVLNFSRGWWSYTECSTVEAHISQIANPAFLVGNSLSTASCRFSGFLITVALRRPAAQRERERARERERERERERRRVGGRGREEEGEGVGVGGGEEHTGGRGAGSGGVGGGAVRCDEAG